VLVFDHILAADGPEREDVARKDVDRDVPYATTDDVAICTYGDSDSGVRLWLALVRHDPGTSEDARTFKGWSLSFVVDVARIAWSGPHVGALALALGLDLPATDVGFV
jgi:hypothetical protein